MMLSVVLSDGVTPRRGMAIVPADWLRHVAAGGKLRVLVALHDNRVNQDTPGRLMQTSGLHRPPSQHTDSAWKFVVLYVNALSLDVGSAWYSGHYSANEPDQDAALADAEAIRALLNALQVRLTDSASQALTGIDREVLDRRIFIVGHGNGGAMAYRLVADAALALAGWRIHAIAVVNAPYCGWIHARDSLVRELPDRSSTLKETMRCVRRGGVMCQTGALTHVPGFGLRLLGEVPSSVKVTCFESDVLTGVQVSDVVARVVDAVARGALTLPLDPVEFTFDQYHDALDSSARTGKVVVTVP